MKCCRSATFPSYAAFAMKEGSPDITEWCNALCQHFRSPGEVHAYGLRPETLAENPCASVKPNRYG